jgi:hypothetical protein
MPALFQKSEIWRRDIDPRPHKWRPPFHGEQPKRERDCARFYPETVGRTAVVSFALRRLPQDALEPPDAVRKKYGLPERYFFLPNQFWKHKNHTLVIKALARLWDHGILVVIAAFGLLQDRRNLNHIQELRAQIAAAGLTTRFACWVWCLTPTS